MQRHLEYKIKMTFKLKDTDLAPTNPLANLSYTQKWFQVFITWIIFNLTFISTRKRTTLAHHRWFRATLPNLSSLWYNKQRVSAYNHGQTCNFVRENETNRHDPRKCEKRV